MEEDREHGADDDEGEEPVGGANEDVLSAIKFQVAAIGKELMCAICRDTFNDPFSLPCNHAFCHDCIKEGLKLRNACPLCQVPAFPRSLQKNNCLGNLATAYETLQQLLSRAAVSSSSSSSSSYFLLRFPLFGLRCFEEVVEDRTAKRNGEEEEEVVGALASGSEDVMPQDEYPTAAVFASVTEPSASPKFVLLGTGLDKKKTAELRQVCNKLGGKMVHKFTKEVTHLVTADSSLTMRRTIKYFLSLLKGGVWIVNWDWIEYSSKQKKFLEESLFEIRGDTVATGAPSKARLNNSSSSSSSSSSASSCSSSSASSSASAPNTRKKLFHGKTFFLAGKFDPPNPKKTELESIIEAGGGTVLSSLQKKQQTRKASNHTDKKRSSEKRKRKEEHEEEEGHETIYVLCDPTCSTEEVKKIERRCGRRPLSLLWLLDSLSHFRLLDTSPYYRDTS
ncbi:E3 ubiquitin-protein ligase TRIM47 [Balamuthia mandrillaris]